MNENAISLSSVSKSFGAFQALKSIDLSVAKGERIVICALPVRANRL